MYKVLVIVHSCLTLSHLLAEISLFTFNDKLSFKENVPANEKTSMTAGKAKGCH